MGGGALEILGGRAEPWWDPRDFLSFFGDSRVLGEVYGKGGSCGLELSVELFKGEFVRVLKFCLTMTMVPSSFHSVRVVTMVPSSFHSVRVVTTIYGGVVDCPIQFAGVGEA